MNKGLVSIVLPIYNVEKYLDRCMDSIVSQTYKNIEIIMVDDGSTDSCYDKCEQWKNRDSRIVVIHKQNEGLGKARNTGLEYATGEYIVFFDSDDYIENDTIEKCFILANSERADVVLFGFSFVNSYGVVTKKVIPSSEKKVLRNDEILDSFLPDLLVQGEQAYSSKNLWMSAWACFYSTETIRKSNWEFVSEREIISEDVYSLLILYANVKCACILEEALYYYCENGGSLTHVFRKDRHEKINIFYNETLEKAKELGYNKQIIDNLNYPYVANMIAMIKMIVNSDISNRDKFKALSEIVSDKTFVETCYKMRQRQEPISRMIFYNLVIRGNILGLFYVVKLNNLKR